MSNGWRNINDEKPPGKGMYLVYAPSADPDKPIITCAWWAESGWSLILDYWAKGITHWQPLPAPPTPQ